MQVLCKSCNTHPDVTCKVCGQGFLVFWSRTSRSEREETLQNLTEALAAHHAADHSADRSPQAHPRTGFTVPSWPGAAAFSGAALLGGAQSWAV